MLLFMEGQNYTQSENTIKTKLNYAVHIDFACYFHNAKCLYSFCTELKLERVTQSSCNHNQLNDTLLLGTLTVALHII